MKTQIIEVFLALKETKPLVHNITNFVVMNNTANALLAVGASPVMSHAKEELEDMLSSASSLVINLGTLDKRWLKSMRKACDIAANKSLPFVLDPVGAGATAYRTDSALKLINRHSPQIIRANASEIMALTNLEANVETKGVDSVANIDKAIESAKALASQHKNTVIMSGETDFIFSNDKQSRVHNGASIMTQVTGMGCTATAMVGACLTVCKDDSHLAAISAMSIMGVAGEIAYDNAKGPGSFQVAFLDALYNLTAVQLGDLMRVTHA